MFLVNKQYKDDPFLPLHDSTLTCLPVTAVAKVFSLAEESLVLQPLAQPRDNFPIEGLVGSLPYLLVTPSLSLSRALSLFVSLPPSLAELHIQQVYFPLKSPLQHFSNARTAVGFQRSARDGITIKSHACKSGSAMMMKRFVTIVLRGLVSLSKENPIWAKEHHRPPKKEIRRKRRAAKRAKTMGRRNLVRAVGISPVDSQLGHWCFLFVRCHSIGFGSFYLCKGLF